MRAALARAPGRVNLIGEHTDYNGGFVLPCAIAASTTVRTEPSADRTLRIATPFGEAAFDLDALPQTRSGDWKDYARGVLIELGNTGIRVNGGSVCVESTVPAGAGLSSSASFEIALALALVHGADLYLAPPALAQLAQRAENEHTGTNSGIMDQAAVLFSQAGNALLLDTRTLEWSLIPVPEEIAIVVADTMQRRSLNEGAYNTRRAECEQAVAVLAKAMPGVTALRDVRPDQLGEIERLLPHELYRRARHVVTENDRVERAAKALRDDDAAAFGALMNASHESLREDYEVSSGALDMMAELARECGAFGSRMTGGGFGGCTVSAVARDRGDEFCRSLARAYHERTGISPNIYDGTPASGATVCDERSV
ncbi:MAG TPA: galactokinase [Candidatus Baltobacteraceae bacterium]|nr:galactokinase [Candidatus Baltobacteraceae bacterium]